MSVKKTNAILTSYPNGGWTPSEIKLGKWTDKQKERFLDHVRNHNPFADGCYYETCSFNVHFDKYVIHSRGFDKPITFKPMHSKNRPNEIIIEIITDEEHRECWPVCPATCPMCIQDGQCTSLFIQKFVGEILFPQKYAKQR